MTTRQDRHMMVLRGDSQYLRRLLAVVTAAESVSVTVNSGLTVALEALHRYEGGQD